MTTVRSLRPRALAAILAGSVTLAVVSAAPAEPTPGVQTLAAVCRSLGLEERLCKSIQALGEAVAHVCSFGGLPEAVCALFRGYEVSESLLAAYEGGWVHRALGYQQELGDPLPLGEAVFPATHNSFNARAYAPTLSGLDSNQVYPLVDQLRMDIRAIELDLHWFPSPSAEPGDGGRAPLLCHATGPHVGCTLERNLREGLLEIRPWLDAHPDEVVLIYFEDHLDNPAGYGRAAATVSEVLGDLIYREPGDCHDGLPLAVSRSHILAAGKQIILASGCGQGAAWPGLVHSQDDNWLEGGTDRMTPSLPCGYTPAEYDANWTRFFEDSTWLTTMVNGAGAKVTPANTRTMTRCGVNMPSFDQLVPDDPRLEALVWSWASAQPVASASANCASHGSAGRFAAADCGTALRFACLGVGGAWAVSASSGAWGAGGSSCPAGYAFAVPRNSPQNEALNAAKQAAGVADVWLNYTDAATDGDWVAGP